jgi:hypothetical protein
MTQDEFVEWFLARSITTRSWTAAIPDQEDGEAILSHLAAT